jgi:tripartite-type tricarboxylate transporter receptor subunit TctC
LAVLCVAASIQPCLEVAHAQPANAPFARKTITVVVGYAPGGSYDLYARLVARNLGRHLPGEPAVVAQNMPGAGSLQAANYIYKVAARDGTALGVVAETLPMEQALRNPGVQYDAAKFTYIGRVASSINIQLAWHTSKAQSMADVMTIPMTVAGTGPANLAETVPRVLNAVAGTRFRIVSGYASSGPGMLAMERGEVDGAGTSWAIVKATKQEWLKSGKAKVILQMLPERSPELPDVPALVEFGKTDADRQLLTLYASGGALGRYVLAPPGVPAATARMLREAFNAMVRDKAFLAEASKAKVDVDPVTHDRLEAVVARTLQVDDSTRKRVREIFKQ